MKFTRNIFRSILLIIISVSVINAIPSSGQVKKSVYKTKKTRSKTILYGTASYYAQKFHGSRTSSGEKFDQEKFTAACNALPLGTWVLVTNLKNSKTVYVRTNDRLSSKNSRVMDVSKAAARRLGFLSLGLTRVKIEVLPGKPD